MSPREWEDFEARIREHYSNRTLYDLMLEQDNLTYVLRNPEKFPKLSQLDFDKINLRLSVVVEVFNKRIDTIILGSERNGS